MKIDKIVEPYFGENMYILIDEDTKKSAVIDPGGAIDKILNYINKNSLDLELYNTNSWTRRSYRCSE